MKPSELMKFQNKQIRVLHFTWIAFFISFFTWFNMAPLATTMVESVGWLTDDHLAALAIINVALTVPARIVVGMLLDKYGPRIVFSALLIIMAFPTFVFAFGNSWMQLFVSRLVLSGIGASFVIGIRIISEWFPPKKVGFAEGFYAGFGNFGSAAAAVLLPWIAIQIIGGDNGWRYAIAYTGVICLIYGIIYFFIVTDTPEGKKFLRSEKIAAMQVSSWSDLIQLIVWTIPLVGVLGLLAWRLKNLNFIPQNTLYVIYVVLLIVLTYQIIQILRVNIPLLRSKETKSGGYRFKNVAALNTTYFANFGAELAIVSMLPTFFLTTFSLTPTTAGLIASSFAFVNLFARPLGGWISDHVRSRKLIMLSYMLGISIGLLGMAFINSSWPIVLAVTITVLTSMFIQGAEGATFAVIPFIKRKMTGQISGMAGAYGNVGAVVYLTLLTFVTPRQFFIILSVGALLSFLYCMFALEEPKDSHGDEYSAET
ncbi:MFS transporter [Cytobacillus sp. IB215665]|uniref:MFS transporter n=1 Tax=Cytobacillus sp. IB215665 TaxID=3097357 RepID=UPI002A12403C|nr:MFS transporter [Cytobacillus sp. IB215665]MDX8366872.1 MFS transporter [Cytobacillus sp. IB215665]